MYTARVKFERGEEIRFISHLDMQRMVQRIMRRAQIPMKYSEGFNPHPKLAFAMALAVGMTSKCEYFDVELESPMEPEEMVERLNLKAPAGFKAVRAMVTEEKLPSLTSMVEESAYTIKGEALSGEKGQKILDNVKELLEKESILQRKRNKKGKYVEREIRPLIRQLEGSIAGKEVTLKARLASGSRQNLRPEVVLHLLDPERDLFDPSESVDLTRDFLGMENGEELF